MWIPVKRTAARTAVGNSGNAANDKGGDGKADAAPAANKRQPKDATPA